jgi:hypothetical protein
MIAKLTKSLKNGEVDPASLPEISALLKVLGVTDDED